MALTVYVEATNGLFRLRMFVISTRAEDTVEDTRVIESTPKPVIVMESKIVEQSVSYKC